MLFNKAFIILLFLTVRVVSAPLYKISLQDKKEFEISSDNKDYNEENENEMIQAVDLLNAGLREEDESRYRPLHSFVENYNKRGNINKMQFTNVFAYLEPTIWESSNIENTDKPFVAGFKEVLDKVLRKVNDLNLYKQLLRTKRQEEFEDSTAVNKKVFTRQIEDTEPGEEAYDYEKLKKEYEEQIGEDIDANKIVNYTAEEKTEENPKEALQKLLDFKNCTEETAKFGIKAIDCLIHNYEHEKKKPVVKKTVHKAAMMIKVWFLIYVCLAIPCWCQYGWCCWCFRFKFCFPRKRILFTKQYYALNPPGTLHTQMKKKKQTEKTVTYVPTEFEEDAYEKLETAIRNI
ncbi:uncharacterized protein LOC143178942 [Calliopsis andreniformis]|uniref:uncharacterized protein LOC143178942 n=1 Tax=Calliopsis andreniformis TaxID=337506 RepID=UPI003FCCC2BC